MIAPEPLPGSNPQTGAVAAASVAVTQHELRLPPLLWRGLLLSAAIFALLEIWRPCFFLTDDNLDGGLPFFLEMGHSLLAGHSPFVSHHLFGGNYHLLRDPDFFCWHPVYLLASLLAGTPFRYALLEVDAFFFLMVAMAGFLTLAHHLRRELPLQLSNGWIIFYALSFTYTMIALACGASWLNFLANYSALPWLALGILQADWRRGVVIVFFAWLHNMLGGHLLPTISNTLFLSLFALGLAMARRSAVPLVNWAAGYALAMVLILPLFLPMLSGFSHSARSGGVALADMQSNNIPLSDFPSSFFLGMFIWVLHPHQHPYTTYTLALGSSAAVWCLIPILARRWVRPMVQAGEWALGRMFPDLATTPETAPSRLLDDEGSPHHRAVEIVTGLVLLAAVVLVIRPVWVTEVMMHLPVLRSMRWPFREFVQLMFFLHLYLVVSPPGLNLRMLKICAVFGTLIYVVPMVTFPLPPTLNEMTWDRELVMSGEADRFWTQVRALMKPGNRYAVLIPLDLYEDDRFEQPYSLLGTFNYACMFGVVNVWGYSPTVPRDQVDTKVTAFFPYGAYLPSQRDALLADQPDLKLIALESSKPLKITLSSRDGPTIDLTPLVPPRRSRIPEGADYMHELEREQKERDMHAAGLAPAPTPVAAPGTPPAPAAR